ncbi:hypothetical protein TEA_023793 [Camellia sinensis var. sinensis]|uniref:Carboxypeptidase n=1 Tax=Camellia sinensis var. sinensis TaxID=542762 RepID=A0A4S4ER03_CAMSN|nr:hypothetical protein TEA_023793 [Camellia sinensis var. sinensis]
MWLVYSNMRFFRSKNEYSWNREANMLYLETPVGVGFSYSTDASSYEAVSDQQTARDNLVFLQRWFLKFPQYMHRDLFITGESYAGHYIPQLAKLMTEFNQKEKLFNLKGVALGNPVLEFATDFNSRAEFFWSHGLISDSTYKIFTSSCNYSRYVSEYYRSSVSPVCSKVMSQVSRETSRFVDKYDVTLDVCISSVLSQSKKISPQQVGEKIDVCVEDETVNYLNRQDVQNAFHARLVGVNRWVVCSDILDYELLDVEIPTISLVGELIKAGIRVLVYSGDQDSVIPLTGSRTLVRGLANQLGLNTTVPYRVWFGGQQVGGWTQVYGDTLSFATIRGASHEAPFSQPGRSLVLFQSFLQGMPLPEIILDYELLDVEIPTISLVGELIKAGIRVLVYSGDQDSVIPLTGSRTLVRGLANQLGLNTTVPYRVWFGGQQVGGWTQVYGDTLSFATIRGASHEAPFSQPGRSLVLFQSFLQGMPLPEMF